MLLVQRVIDDSSEVSLMILNKVFPNMKALEKAMKEHPENFNENYEYSLVDPRPFVKVTYAKFPILETTNPFKVLNEMNEIAENVQKEKHEKLAKTF